MPRPSSTTASRAAASSAHRTAQHHSQHAQQSANPLRSGGAGALDKAAAAQASSTASVLRGRHFPNPVAVFSESFVFTTLDEGHLEKHRRAPFVHPHTKQACRLFTLDNEVEYRPFARDYGPLNLAYTVHGVCTIQDIIKDQPANARPLCLYTMNAPETKANVALLASIYFMLVGGLDPASAFMPIAKLEVMPFRDAGNGVFDHALSIQDCLYGIEKAHRCGLLDLDNFDIKDYVYYEQVNNGDLNLLGPFIPFASPIEEAWQRAMQPRWQAIATAERNGEQPPIQRPLMKGRLTGNQAFKNVLGVFEKQQVGLVVRLNDELYDKRHFTDLGMEHAEMYFDDGTCPTDEIVRDFIDRSIEQIEQGKKVAVHCKAGLGRTGVLIGAYFIYKYGFSAQEVIGFMRIVRPGMVVGPQQQYMLVNQMKWAQWAARDELRRELGLLHTSEATTQLATPPADSDLPLPPLPPKEYPTILTSSSASFDIEMDHQDSHNHMLSPSHLSHSHGHEASHHKHGDAVGQPRKTANASGKRYVEATPTPTRPPSSAGADRARSTLSPSRMPSPSPTPERTLSAEQDNVKAKSAKAASASGSNGTSANSAHSSMRGTKRGNAPRGTVTAQQAFAPHTPAPTGPTAVEHKSSPTTPRAALDLPTRLPYLERSPSLVSVTSDNDRPRKRVHGAAPSSLPLSPLCGGTESKRSSGASIAGQTQPYGSAGSTVSRNAGTGAGQGGNKLRKEQNPPVSTAGGGGRYGYNSNGGSQSFSAIQPSAATSTTAAPNARSASRIPGLPTSNSAPASTRRHASPLRERTAQPEVPSSPYLGSSTGTEGDTTPLASGNSHAAPGSRIPRMPTAPSSPLIRALKSAGYGSGSDKSDKEDGKVSRGKGRVVPKTGIPTAASMATGTVSAPAGMSRRQAMMGALSPPRLGAMWSGLGRANN